MDNIVILDRLDEISNLTNTQTEATTQRLTWLNNNLISNFSNQTNQILSNNSFLVATTEGDLTTYISHSGDLTGKIKFAVPASGNYQIKFTKYASSKYNSKANIYIRRILDSTIITDPTNGRAPSYLHYATSKVYENTETIDYPNISNYNFSLKLIKGDYYISVSNSVNAFVSNFSLSTNLQITNNMSLFDWAGQEHFIFPTNISTIIFSEA